MHEPMGVNTIPDNEKQVKLTVQTLNRLTYYYSWLKRQQAQGSERTTATAIADELGINEVVVRKDLSVLRQEKGRPNTGLSVEEMVERIEDCLGYNNTMQAVLAGVGNLGKTLMTGMGLEKFGVQIICGFDTDPQLVGTNWGGVEILPLSRMENLCRRMHVQVGVLAVPEAQAQEVCDRMVKSGIRYILNYAQVFLNVPDTVYVQNENPAASLISFFRHIRSKEEH